DLGSKEISTNIDGEFTNLEILKCWSLETLRRSFRLIGKVSANQCIDEVQKLRKDSWLELQFSLADNSKLNVVCLLNRSSNVLLYF
ncbi:hypothetical protein Tco_1158426, partial [Tanacetum coccineum]